MAKVCMIGLDLAKDTIQAHGADGDGAVVFRRKVARSKLLEFLAGFEPCIVAMEACAGAHHWGRAIMDLGACGAPDSSGLREAVRQTPEE